MKFFSLFCLGLLLTGMALGALIEMGVVTAVGMPMAALWVGASALFAALFSAGFDAGGDALYQENTPKAGCILFVMVGVVIAVIFGLPLMMR